MRTKLKNAAIAALTATTLITSAASPAAAGKSERAFLLGVLATAAVGGLVLSANNANARSTSGLDDAYRPAPARVDNSRYDTDRFDYGRDRYRRDTRPEFDRYSSRGTSAPVRHAPEFIRLEPSERAFRALDYRDRRRVQERLARAGYYGYGIDGQWGPATERAVTRFARDNGAEAALYKPEGARRLYSAILTY